MNAEDIWHTLSKNFLKNFPFALHVFLFKTLFPKWPAELDSAPAWIPEEKTLQKSNIFQFMSSLGFTDVTTFHAWSAKQYDLFWEKMIEKLRIVFKKKPEKIVDLSSGFEKPSWLPNAQFNIVDSCFTAPLDKIAIICNHKKITYRELNELSNRVANSLVQLGFTSGDAIAIDMPMHELAVAIYLGIIKMGGVVVSIADSFSKEEIATRLQIAKTKAIFTQDFILRDTKKLPLYEKVTAANAPFAIVLPSAEKIALSLRPQDKTWKDFLIEKKEFDSISSKPMAPMTILFSSGTTGTPKAIPWNHTTPIKVASDAFFHQNVKADDILVWPTNLGWMMGPWLIFASLINHATIALYDGVPRERAFGEFIQDNHVTILGVVPTLVATWRQTQCMEGLNWQSIRLFTSTGECSNAEDMLYLMSLAGYKPVIEYCGGTEIGGAYISSTVIEKNYPSVFTTPTMGSTFTIINEEGNATDLGEVALIPPALGASTELMNANHHEIYFANMPQGLRRHGDQLHRLKNNTYTILGRMDDTMNLGAIKTSAVEIERVLAGIENIIETAAIAIPTAGQGPSQLVIYAATEKSLDKDVIKKEMQARINQHLNPLFKIHGVIFVKELPKTASNKIMRRKLRSG